MKPWTPLAIAPLAVLLAQSLPARVPGGPLAPNPLATRSEGAMLAPLSAAPRQESPVFEAIARGDEQAVTALLDRSLPLTTTNAHGYSLVHWAALTRQPRIAALLVSRGAPVNVTGPDGRTPIHDAASGGDVGLVRLLVDAGARVYTADALGKSPLDLAVEQGHKALFPLLKPLHAAAERGDLDAVRLLAQAEPAAVLARDESRALALHVAARSGRRQVVAALLDAGADINAGAACGETPLRLALEHGAAETAAFLRSKNAIDQSDDALLRKPLKPGEAVLWFLFDAGWVVRTSTHVLVFDYVPARHMALPPTVRPCLSSGEIDPAQLADQRLVVFASFLRDPQHRDAIFSWRSKVPSVAYVVGDRTAGDPAATYIAPRTERSVGGLRVLAIPTTGYGEGFIVRVDGLTIFYAGDHQGSERLWEPFVREIDFVRTRVPALDIVFLQMRFETQMSTAKGVLYALQALRPAAMFPNSAVAGEPFFPGLVRTVADAGLQTMVRSARHRGDVFFYPDSRGAGATSGGSATEDRCPRPSNRGTPLRLR